MQKILPAIVILFALAGFMYCDRASESQEPVFKSISLENLVEIPPLPLLDEYGYEVGHFGMVNSRVQRNESLYIILRRHGISPQLITSLQRAARPYTNISRVMPGLRYRLYSSDEEVTGMVWHLSTLEYLSFDWRSGEIEITRGSIPLNKKERVTSGVIYSSLYETIQGLGESQMVGNSLAEMFAWEIDFFALQRGDQFKIVFEELYAGEQFYGIGKIKAAEFIHRGQTYKGYHFDNGLRMGYFNEEGNSLQKALLKAPFRYSQRVSSGFSHNRFHPILQRNRPHYGIDYAAPTGTPVLAVGDGVVTEARYRGSNGNIVQIRHNGTYATAYLHLNGFAPGIRQGAQVKQGQVIGYVGQTGLATGPHLCYRMYVNGQPVNSLRVELPASEALEEHYMEEFEYLRRVYDEMLEGITVKDRLASN
jgi:murein DD-endopeptidase MepM/ murein hydrolase activator NlpD